MRPSYDISPALFPSPQAPAARPGTATSDADDRDRVTLPESQPSAALDDVFFEQGETGAYEGGLQAEDATEPELDLGAAHTVRPPPSPEQLRRKRRATHAVAGAVGFLVAMSAVALLRVSISEGHAAPRGDAPASQAAAPAPVAAAPAEEAANIELAVPSAAQDDALPAKTAALAGSSTERAVAPATVAPPPVAQPVAKSIRVARRAVLPEAPPEPPTEVVTEPASRGPVPTAAFAPLP